MIVYKYARAEIGIRILEKGLVRFTQADALNDPFEIRPCMTKFRAGLIEEGKALLGRAPTEAELAKMQILEEEQFRNPLLTDYIMFCLSKRNNNTLMWSHYAECHKGVVFGFDANHSFFQGRPLIMSKLFTVNYSDERYVLPKRQDWGGNEAAMADTFLRKSIDWAYEMEMRVLAQSAHADEVGTDEQGLPVYLFKYPKGSLSEVIFGVFTESTTKQVLTRLLRNDYPHVALHQARLSERTFDLDISPLPSKEL
jgi:Protein of unknown function (DUF2971)